MKRAELLLGYMDKMKSFIELIKSYLERGLEFMHLAGEWIEKILGYIERGVEYLVEHLGGRPENQIGDEYLFV